MGWKEVTTKTEGPYFTLEPGKKDRIHIVSSEPLSFRSFFDDKNKKTIRVPFDRYLPALKMAERHAFVVLVEREVEGKTVALPKVFEMCKTLAGEIGEAYQLYENSFEKVDFVITKKKEGEKTTWGQTVCPAKGMKTDLPLPKLEDIFKMSTQEEIESVLPVPF